MVNLVGFTQGMREQRGTLNRRRRELANAFNDFKAANPTATFDEYQSFIDQYTGDGLGSNYLRGGAPSEEVLQTLASENEKRREAQEEQALLESLRRRGETQGQLQGIADEVLLGMPGDDFEKGYQTFVERLGGEEAEEQFGRDRLQSYFGPNRLNTLANERVRQLLPDIRAYVESVDPNSIDAATLSEQFGVKNQAVLNPILETARTEAQRVNNDRIRQNRTQMINVMTSALQSGQDPVARVQAVYGDTNINLDSENIAPLLEEAQTTYEQDRQRVENQREQDRIDLTARVRDSLAGNEALQSAIRTGTKEDALRIIREEAQSRLSSANFELAFGAEGEGLQSLYDSILGQQRELAEAQYGQYVRESDQRVREVGQQAVEDSVTTAVETNKARFEGDVEPSIAGQLARRYNWTPAVQAAFETLMASDSIDKDATASEVANQIAKAPEFEAVAIPMSQQQERLREQARPFPLSTMEEGINRLSQDLEQTTRSELSDLLDNAAQIEDLGERARDLDIIRRTIQAERENFSSRLRSFAEQRSVWLKPGGGGWNQEAVNGFARDASAAFDQMEQRLRRLEQELQAERAEAKTGSDGEAATSSPDTPAPRTQTTGPGGGNPGAGEPPIAEWWRRTVENMPANRGNPLGDR